MADVVRPIGGTDILARLYDLQALEPYASLFYEITGGGEYIAFRAHHTEFYRVRRQQGGSVGILRPSGLGSGLFLNRESGLWHGESLAGGMPDGPYYDPQLTTHLQNYEKNIRPDSMQ